MWIHMPSEHCPSVQESADLTSDLDWLFSMLEQSVMWRTKPLPARRWLRVSKTVSWMTRLSGQICELSIASRGVERWIASWADSHASHSPMLAVSKALKTQGISGPTSLESFKIFTPLGASLKMYGGYSQPELLIGATPIRLLRKTYIDWVTRLSQDYFLRKRWGQPTAELGYSSWPTATLHGNYNKIGTSKNSGNGLSTVAKMWRSPSGSDGEGGIFDLSQQPPQSNPKLKLRDQASNWNTPNESMWKGGNHSEVGQHQPTV